MAIKQPVHPGRIVKSACLEALNLTVTQGAKILGITRPTLSNIINGKAAISPEMAIRLAKVFGSRAEVWLRMQMAHDLAKAEQKSGRLKLRRYHTDDSQTA
ncbi:MAG: HigA family addiction module antidote protein [Alphaproteobacteria bacterium]|nr:HigA family addiction module antidote protein [Alphaproteobacteria bacterium]